MVRKSRAAYPEQPKTVAIPRQSLDVVSRGALEAAAADMDDPTTRERLMRTIARRAPNFAMGLLVRSAQAADPESYVRGSLEVLDSLEKYAAAQALEHAFAEPSAPAEVASHDQLTD